VVDGTAGLAPAVVPATATGRVRMELANLELIGDDVVENKILSSRLAHGGAGKGQSGTSTT
jgi:hypothetical protein